MVKVESRRANWFMALFAWYARGLVGRSFGALRVRGRLRPPGRRVLYVVNHSAWWDAIVVFLLSRDEPRMAHHALMAERGLARFPFFARLGAVAVPDDRGSAGMRALISYVDRWVAEANGGALWVFPQGEIMHAEKRPLGVRPGSARIARRAAPCEVVPVALRYEFGEGQWPELFASVGEGVVVEGSGAGARGVDVEELLRAEVDRLRDDLAAGRTEGFRVLVPGRASVSDRWEGFKRALGAGGATP